jgi:hypothetical protein
MLLLIVLFALLPVLAQAQDLEDSDYVDYYFGTQVVLTMATPVNDRTRVYWGDMLPQEYTYGQISLVEVINDQRRADGRDDLLNISNYPIVVSSDRQLEDGSWAYYIEFHGCTPSEAQLVLDKFGVGDSFADAAVSFEPVKIAYYSNYISSIGLMALELPGGTVEFDPADPIEQYFDDIEAALAAKYGDSFAAEIYFSVGKSVLGPDSTSVSVSVYLDGAEEGLYVEHYDY